MSTPHPHRNQYAIDARTAKSVAAHAGLRCHDATPHALAHMAAQLRTAADLMERQAVLAARAEGLTWAEVAAWFGITRQAAQQRFGSTD